MQKWRRKGISTPSFNRTSLLVSMASCGAQGEFQSGVQQVVDVNGEAAGERCTAPLMSPAC